MDYTHSTRVLTEDAMEMAPRVEGEEDGRDDVEVEKNQDEPECESVFLVLPFGFEPVLVWASNP